MKTALSVLGLAASIEAALAAALRNPVAEAVEAGWHYADRSADPADHLRAGALNAALAQLDIDLRGVGNTSVEQIGDQLAASVDAGEPTAVAAERIEPILHDRERAEMIARTEIARAMEASVLAYGREVGGMDKEWLDAPGACPICQANAAEGTVPIHRAFASGDEAPPAHPRCRCALALVGASD